MSALEVLFYITLLSLESSWKVRAGFITVTDILVPIQVCHKALYLLGIEKDDKMTTSIINALLFLDQPFEFYTSRHYQRTRFVDLTSAGRVTCHTHIVLLHASPYTRQTEMNIILKRFRRAKGNENDFVLVFAETKDGISKSINWKTGSLKYVMPRNFPENAILIELDDYIKRQTGRRRHYVSDVYTFQLYCDEEQEVCWRHRSFAVFPQYKCDFDAAFSIHRAQWRYDYNGWPILVYIESLENIDGVEKMTFRHVTWGRFTQDDYHSLEKDKPNYYAPMIWLTFQIANHVNATLQPRTHRITFEQRTEIRPWEIFPAHRVLESYPNTRNVYVNFGYYIFGYCTNGTEERGTTNIFAFFTPYDFISWIMLVLVMIAIAVVGWFAGHGFQLFQLVACLGSQSYSVNSNSRLAALFVLWHLVAFLVINCYSAFLESVLAVPNPLPRIQDFKTLSKSCDVVWVYVKAQADLKERFRDIQHMKTLMDRSKVTSDFEEPKFFHEILVHGKQCIIRQPYHKNSFWTEMSTKFLPGATCSEGMEKLIGDPVTWIIHPPNAGVIYRTVRALEAAGILSKFREYFEHRHEQRIHLFVKNRLQKQQSIYNETENTNEERSDSEDIGGFTMENLKTVFKSYLIVSSGTLLVFLLEFSQLFVQISCRKDRE